jgi:hypothetical protein
MRIDLRTQRRILLLVSSVFIMLVLFCSHNALAGPDWLPPLSDSSAASPSVDALYTDGSMFGHVGWEPTPTQGEDAQFMMSVQSWSIALMALAVIMAFAGTVYYMRRDPIVIDDEPLGQYQSSELDWTDSLSRRMPFQILMKNLFSRLEMVFQN